MSSLPISDILSEATPDSINELFSRSPERYDNEDRDISRIIDELRANRERNLRAEAMGAKPPKPVRMDSPVTKRLPKDPVDISGFEI